jgi:hypothetical protein
MFPSNGAKVTVILVVEHLGFYTAHPAFNTLYSRAVEFPEQPLPKAQHYLEYTVSRLRIMTLYCSND